MIQFNKWYNNFTGTRTYGVMEGAGDETAAAFLLAFQEKVRFFFSIYTILFLYSFKSIVSQ